ncbi:MAG: YfcE family phosphodiesterase, partial [Ignavibacteriales bacterium]|nr:YfcE family phosphodiesterase [Ignavibacteriales bacterium]
VGSSSVRKFIEKHQPDLAVCGHIHEARGQDSLEKSKIVNCGPAVNGYYAVVEIHHSIEIRNHHFLN